MVSLNHTWNNNMSRYKYFFLDDRNFYRSRNTLRGNPRIIKFDPYMFWIKRMDIPSPSFSTVNELSKKDQRFVRFRKERPRSAALLSRENHIIDTRDLVLTGNADHIQAGRMLLHIIEGNRNTKEFSGIHFLPLELPTYVKNFVEVEPPNEQGISRVTFDIENDNGKLLKKKDDGFSTLFPRHWSFQDLYDECLFALEHRVRIPESQNSFTGATRSGIPVEMHFNEKGNFINTLYPIRI